MAFDTLEILGYIGHGDRKFKINLLKGSREYLLPFSKKSQSTNLPEVGNAFKVLLSTGYIIVGFFPSLIFIVI